MAELDAALAGQPEVAPASPARQASPVLSAAQPAAGQAGGDAARLMAEEGAPEVAAQESSAETAPEHASDDEEAGHAAPVAAQTPVAPPKKVVAVRGDDRPGMKKAEPVARDGRRDGAPGRPDARGGRDARGAGAAPYREQRDWREEREPRGPRLGDAAFRAQRQAIELAQASLRKLAAQAHGEVLTQLMTAWEQRDPQQLPTAQALGPRLSPALRTAWATALSKPAGPLAGETLLRLEMAAEVPTPAEHLSERRMLQLQLLTRRNAASPADTWGEDVAKLLSSAFDPGAARRLQTVLKVLLKR
jgi:hypothetical protein